VFGVEIVFVEEVEFEVDVSEEVGAELFGEFMRGYFFIVGVGEFEDDDFSYFLGVVAEAEDEFLLVFACTHYSSQFLRRESIYLRSLSMLEG